MRLMMTRDSGLLFGGHPVYQIVHWVHNKKKEKQTNETHNINYIKITEHTQTDKLWKYAKSQVNTVL